MTEDEIYNLIINRLDKYHPTKEYSLIKKAYEIAKDGHKEQIRKSGEPYIIHPISVAYILAELELDIESIVSGILHDVIEDTIYTYEDLHNLFGKEIADIVKGVTKLDNIEDDMNVDFQAKHIIYNESDKTTKLKLDLQAENYRKMFLAMAKDIRVILIKIADRLHNMRTLQFMSEEKQKIKAKETLEIYAPLAHRLGISKIRYELEDLSFKYLYLDEYNTLALKINAKEKQSKDILDRVIDELKHKIEEYNLNFSIDGRTKHLFSIYKKMKTQNKKLEQIFDIFALRIIVDEKKDCYEVLGIVHDIYKPMPSRFKDYIGMPKSNMYQSIHTVVMGLEGEPIEIQIRTKEMHRNAEYGIAAHWKYKEGRNSEERINNEEAKLSWLRQMLDWQKDLSNNDFIQALKTDLNIFTDNVYCFSSKGEIVSLVKGSTPIDFAYSIHSALGNRMVGAKVNGAIVPFSYELVSSDKVIILESQNSKGPSMEWLNIVKTSQARAKIMQWFNKENKSENINKGKELLEKHIKKNKFDINLILTNNGKELILRKYGFKDWDTLCAAVGRGGIKEGHVLNKLYDNYIMELEKTTTVEEKFQNKSVTNRTINNDSGVQVSGLNDASIRFSKCCSPIPGDEIVGFITRGRGVSIHRTDCANILNIDEIERNRLIESEWINNELSSKDITYTVYIEIIVEDSFTVLHEISKVMINEKIKIINVNSKTNNGVLIYSFGINIVNKKELEKITNKISFIKDVIKIDRIN